MAQSYWKKQPVQYLMHRDGTPVSKVQVLTRLRQTLNLIHKTKNTELAAHSFRIGQATELKKLGVSDEKIRKIGHWKSGAYKLYLCN